MAFKLLTFDRLIGMLYQLMQTDKNDVKVEKSVSMHSHAFERPWKRQIVTFTKSRNASHVSYKINISESLQFDLKELCK